MLKMGWESNRNIGFLRESSKKLTKSFIAVGFVAALSISQSLSYAQELLPNATLEISSDVDDDSTEIIKVLREELEGWEGYTCSFLAMLSDNEIKYLYRQGLELKKQSV